MPTVLDTFVVEIGLDPKKLSQGQQEALDKLKRWRDEVERRGKDIEDSSKRTTQFLSRLKGEAIGLFAAFLGARGIKEFVSNLVAGDAATGRFARTMGTSSDELAKWQAAAKLWGGSAEQVGGTMQGLKDQIQAFESGLGGNIVPLFAAISREGGKLVTIKQPFNEMMRNLADDLQRIDKITPGRGGFFGRQIPLDEATLSRMIKGGAAGLREGLDAAEKLGHATQADTDKAEDLITKWESIGQLLKNLGRVGFYGLTEKVLTQYQSGLEEIQKKTESWWTAIAIALAGPFAPLFFSTVPRKPAGAKPPGTIDPATGAPTPTTEPAAAPTSFDRRREIPSTIDEGFGHFRATTISRATHNTSNQSSSASTEIVINGPIQITPPPGADPGRFAADFRAKLLSYAERNSLAGQANSGTR